MSKRRKKRHSATVILEGRKYKILPLDPFKAISLKPNLDLVKMGTLEGIESWTPLILAGFRQTYPKITQEEVEELITMENFADLLSAILKDAAKLNVDLRISRQGR